VKNVDETERCEICGQEIPRDGDLRCLACEAEMDDLDAKLVEESMKQVLIEGKPVLRVWESMTAWYWFATERVSEHIWFGLVRGLETEWGYWDERELRAIPWIWEVKEDDWIGCPLVTYEEVTKV
jgi:hypothetical protein